MKNPFELTKRTTVRRDANQIYKGLNKVDLVAKSPLDILFRDLEKTLEGQLEDLTVETLYDRIFKQSLAQNIKEESTDLSLAPETSSSAAAVTTLNPTGNDSPSIVSEDDAFNIRYDVISHLLSILLQIQELSQQQKFKDESLIKISLHDIKTFSKLVNIIIIQGVYPALANFQIGIPFVKRNLKSFTSSRIVIAKLPPSANYSYNEKLLGLLYEKFSQLFSRESDVKDLLIKGTGYSDFLTISIALQTIPSFKDSNAQYVNDFPRIIELPQTYELFSTYSLLVATPSPIYFKQFVLEQLQCLHFNAPRQDGLLTLIEFVTGYRESEDIEVAKFEQVTSIVLAKPRSITTENYFTNIGGQCYNLLININRPVVTSCVGFILENLWQKNPRIVQDFVLKTIWNNFDPPSNSTDEVALNNTINVLISLTKKITNTEFMISIIKPILLPLWDYYTFLQNREKPTNVITNILVSYFVIISNSKDEEETVYGLDTIAKNLLFDGGSWNFQFGPNGLTEISEKLETIMDNTAESVQKFVDNLDKNCKYLIQLLENLDESLVNKLFVTILKRWLNNNSDTNLSDENPFFTLIDLRLLEGMGEKFKESLARTPKDMLELVNSVLLIDPKLGNDSAPLDDVDSDDEDEEDGEEYTLKTLSVVLELLSAILTETLDLDVDCRNLIASIQSSLKKFAPSSEIYNSAKSLSDRIDIILKGENKPSSEKEAQQQILTRAITSLNDPLVPIRAHGLYLLRQLIEMKSEVVNLDFVINLHLVQLKDPEPFIYLNVIKGLESLIDMDQETVIHNLCSLYVNKDSELDEKLRIGEVLLRYIQGAEELFTGALAQLIVETMLSVITKPVNKDKGIDDRLRMSAMSILGMCCNTNPIGMYNRLEDALDCAIGILQLETANNQAIMRNSAIVLIHDLIIGSSKSEAVPFPNEYREKVFNVLQYIKDTDNDLLVREQAQIVLNTIEEISQQAFELLREQQEDKFKIFRIDN